MEPGGAGAAPGERNGPIYSLLLLPAPIKARENSCRCPFHPGFYRNTRTVAEIIFALLPLLSSFLFIFLYHFAGGGGKKKKTRSWAYVRKPEIKLTKKP